ncbi:MAG TPA: SufBD protein [Spirochaetes bacterium]|mgnify:CR=1 FL=1|nr:SufBD protein [Spirochaetota bacterium]
MKNYEVSARSLYDTTDVSHDTFNDPEVAHLEIHHNMVLGSHLVPGLEADIEELENGIRMNLRVLEGVRIARPVHLCFGMIPETGVQEIYMNVHIGKNAGVSIMAHCTFPNAVDVVHRMEADITVDENAEYAYFERHVHGSTGGIQVVPRARVTLEKGARFKTEFELLRGRVGAIEIDYETTCKEDSVMEMDARINGTHDDSIKIRETGHLVGAGARGVLTSRIAVRNNAQAEVYNKITATAPYARGHVDCKEIVQDRGVATAIPIVEVRDPRAHVTHEAAIGSVDTRQLETLMSRGLSEDDAVELIIQGLLS